MEFVDYDWDDIESSFVKEGILGAEFTFNTKSDLTLTIDYLPKNQARKLYTFAKEQLDLLKNPKTVSSITTEEKPDETVVYKEVVEEVATEEVTNFAEIMPSTFEDSQLDTTASTERKLSELSQDELFEKLQNYKKLLDNGLILQGEYDNLKKEVLSYM